MFLFYWFLIMCFYIVSPTTFNLVPFAKIFSYFCMAVKTILKLMPWQISYVVLLLLEKCIRGFVQDCSISIADAMEILQSYTKPSVYSIIIIHWAGICSKSTGNLEIIEGMPAPGMEHRLSLSTLLDGDGALTTN